MSGLVRGMDLPTSCGTCHLRKSNEDRVWCPILGEYICFETEFLGRKINCPLVEVPAPHGRLIDADAFDERVRVAGGMSEEELTEDFKDGVQTVLYMLSKQPTIIEAEGSEEEE